MGRFTQNISPFSNILRPMVLGLLCLMAVPTLAQVNATIDSTQIKIGEQLTYSMAVEADTTDFVSFPEGQTFLPLEVIESFPIDTTFSQGKATLIKKYGLTQFDSGVYVIPSQRVFINEKSFLTDSLSVEVNNVVVDTTVQKMYDIRPGIEVDAPAGRYGWLLVLLAGLLVGGAIAYFYSKRKKAQEEAAQQLPPYEEAIEALKELDASKIDLSSRPKAYYSALTEIVKRYLDREVDNTALESTSNELIERLQLLKDSGNFEFSTDTIKSLDAILKRADLVKFAKMTQERGQATVDRRQVEEIINDTKEILPEPTEEELLEDKQYLEMLERKRKRKRLVAGSFIVAGALFASTLVYGFVYGFDELKDQIFGNDLRELAEGQWVLSEYGVPAVVIETPDVLVRMNIATPDSLAFAVKSMDFFEMGGEGSNSPFQVLISTSNFTQPQNTDMNLGLEGVLASIERRGATNLIVKREDFETDKGIKGLRAYGTFKPAKEDRRRLEEVHYEILYFAQDQGIQQIMMVYEEDQKYAPKIVQRIKNSVELEIPKS